MATVFVSLFGPGDFSVFAGASAGDLTWTEDANLDYDLGWDTVSHADGDAWDPNLYPNIISDVHSPYTSLVAGRYYTIRAKDTAAVGGTEYFQWELALEVAT